MDEEQSHAVRAKKVFPFLPLFKVAGDGGGRLYFILIDITVVRIHLFCGVIGLIPDRSGEVDRYVQ
jgi:hypothetical protein